MSRLVDVVPVALLLCGLSTVWAGPLATPAAAAAPTGVVTSGGSWTGQDAVPIGPSGVATSSSDSDHGLTLPPDGTVGSWGDDNYDRTTVPAVLSAVTAIAAAGANLGAMAQAVGPRSVATAALNAGAVSAAAVCPSSISFGQTIQCSIDSAGETDTYTFTASAGDKVLVRMSQASGTLYYPGVRVYSPTATKLCEETTTIDTAEIASCTLPSAGTYSILAFDGLDGTHTGDYDLFLQRLNNPGNGVSIAFGHTLAGSIDTPAQADTYTFTASAGDKVLVRMSQASGTLYYPGVRVYGPTATKLCEETTTIDTAEIASCTLPSAGTYSILAFDGLDGTHTGDYDLFLQRLNNPGNGVSIAFGHTLAGSIDTPAQTDTYTFTASAGDKVLVRMSQASGTLYYPGVRVYSPTATKLCEETTTIDTAEIASCTLPSAGTYSILAFDGLDGTHTGDYDLFLQRLNNPGNGVSIAFGHTLAGSIDTPAQMDTYTFTASAGDKVLVRMSQASGTIWPGVRVYAPDATKVCVQSGPSAAEIASCTLPSTGKYMILAFDSLNGELTGGYMFSVSRVPTKTLAVSASSPWVAGVAHTVTVTGKDAYGDTTTGYRGKVHFTSTDPAAMLPADYTFTAADNGSTPSA